jgi:hypothetical protein
MGRGNHRNIICMEARFLKARTILFVGRKVPRNSLRRIGYPRGSSSANSATTNAATHPCPPNSEERAASSNWSIRRHQLPNPNAIRHRNVTWINPAALLASYCSITILTLIRILWLSPGSHRKTSTTWRKAASSGSILPTRAKIRVMLLASQQNPGRLWRWRLHS